MKKIQFSVISAFSLPVEVSNKNSHIVYFFIHLKKGKKTQHYYNNFTFTGNGFDLNSAVQEYVENHLEDIWRLANEINEDFITLAKKWNKNDYLFKDIQLEYPYIQYFDVDSLENLIF